MGRTRLSPAAIALLVLVPVAAVVLGAGLWATFADDDGGSSGEALTTKFTPPAPYELATLEQSLPFRCQATDDRCSRTFLASVTERWGPRAALGLLERLKQEGRVAPSLNDHDLAHEVGRTAAKRFGSNFQSFDLCPITFNYGCPHGYFEYVLGRTETPKAAAALICESLGSNRLLNAGFSCYHGVGHGVMMARAYDLDASLRTCNTLGRHNAREGCWQGVFMENVNAGMTKRARAGVFSRSDPLAPCNRVATQYRTQCFLNHAGYLMYVSSNKLEQATGYCLAAPNGFRSACMQSIGLMVTNPVWQANLTPAAGRGSQAAVAAELCRRFPAGSRRDCVIAGVDNLANFDQLRVNRERAFCALVDAGLQPACYRQIGVNLRGRTKREAVLRARCSLLPATRRSECLLGAGLPPEA